MFAKRLMQLVVMLASTLGAGEASAQVEREGLWVGTIRLTTAAGECDLRFSGGLLMTSLYRPANVAANGDGARLTIRPRASQATILDAVVLIKISAAFAGEAGYTGNAIFSGATTDRLFSSRIRNMVSIPAQVTNETRVITLTGTLSDFIDTGCQVRMKATYLKVPPRATN